MTVTDPVQAVALTLTEHRPSRAYAFICTCGYMAGGFGDLTLHRSRAIVAAARPAIEREAKAETERLRHLLGSHADGHLCTCEMIDPGVYHGENMHPPEWEQDPWCPTHPDVNYIKTEVAARVEEQRALRQVERDALAARLAAVEALAEGPTGGGYQPYAVIIGTETHLTVLLDDLRAALATGTTTNQQEGEQ